MAVPESHCAHGSGNVQNVSSTEDGGVERNHVPKNYSGKVEPP